MTPVVELLIMNQVKNMLFSPYIIILNKIIFTTLTICWLCIEYTHSLSLTMTKKIKLCIKDKRTSSFFFCFSYSFIFLLISFFFLITYSRIDSLSNKYPSGLCKEKIKHTISFYKEAVCLVHQNLSQTALQSILSIIL